MWSLPRLIGLGFLLAFAATLARGANWPGWRGPTGSGTTDERDLPLTWDGKTGQNILWKASLKDLTGYSSPIVWRDRVFLTSAAKQTREQETANQIPEHHLRCYSAGDGKELWTTLIPHGPQPAGYAIYAVPTPVTDGSAVYCWFGSAVIACVDFQGKLLWRHERAGSFKLNPGICSSPILYQDTVLLLCDEGGGLGWLQALDKKTGEVKWEQKRANASYCNTTPLLISVNCKPEMIVAASEQLQGLDPSTGQPIWWCKARGFGSSPVYGSGLVYSDSGNGEAAVIADPTGQGDVTKAHLKWTTPRVPCQYGSAVISEGYVYRATDQGVVICRSLATGQQVFAERTEGVSKLSSPFSTADGRVYFANGDKSFVLKSGPKFEVLAMNKLDGGDNAASAAVSDGKIFIRGNDWLYCIGKK